MERDAQTKEAIRCTWIGAIIDALLGFSKILIGTLFHSAALVADGIHSLSDLFTDAFVVVIVKISRAKPDKNHPYGHERFETLGTVALGLVLVAVAGAMAYESISALILKEIMLLPGWPALLVALISIIAKEGIYRYTAAIGRRIKSDLLIANAWHSRTDAYSSIVVLIGIAGAMTGLPWLDTLAAVVVALFVAKIGWSLCWKSLKELVDTAIEPALETKIRATALKIEGIKGVHRFKSRSMGQKILLEMHIQVSPYLSASEGHFLGDAVVTKLLQNFDNIGHVIFHIDTEYDVAPTVCTVLPFRTAITAEIDQALAKVAPTLKRQHVVLHYLNNRIEVDLHVSNDDRIVSGIKPTSVAQQLNDSLCHHSWFKHLNLWFIPE